jgi:hypothetical protein
VSNQYTISQGTIDKLILLARQSAYCDEEDFNAYDYSGGNYDDAHRQGYNDAEIHMAQMILDELGIDYE